MANIKNGFKKPPIITAQITKFITYQGTSANLHTIVVLLGLACPLNNPIIENIKLIKQIGVINPSKNDHRIERKIRELPFILLDL